jgi:hypothetical protein
VSKGKSKGKSVRGPVRASGPLGMWRLSLSVAVSALATGMGLLGAARTGQHLDLMMGRSLGAACLVYIALGKINRIFVDAAQRDRGADDLDDPAGDGD